MDIDVGIISLVNPCQGAAISNPVSLNLDNANGWPETAVAPSWPTCCVRGVMDACHLIVERPTEK